jgi:hypothetical protein
VFPVRRRVADRLVGGVDHDKTLWTSPVGHGIVGGQHGERPAAQHGVVGPQGDEVSYGVQETGRVVALFGDGGPVWLGLDRQVQRAGRAGEPGVGLAVPVHRGARSRPVVGRAEPAAFHVGCVDLELEADFVAVVDGRCGGQGEQHSERGGELMGGAPGGGQAGEVVIAAGKDRHAGRVGARPGCMCRGCPARPGRAAAVGARRWGRVRCRWRRPTWRAARRR